MIEMPLPEKRQEIIDNLNLRSLKLLLPENEYKNYADRQNAQTVLDIRKKEVIKYLRKGNLMYLFKKLFNLRLIHLRLFLQYIRKSIIKD